MAQAPAHISSSYNAPQSSSPKNSVSYIKEKTKADLFQAINDQNVLHGAWQEKVQDWYDEKVEKMMERTKDRKIAKELATKQIQKVRATVWKDKLATPGTKKNDTHYENKGDSDGEGAIFLMKKFILGKRSFTHYLTHQEIEDSAQSTDLSNNNVLRMFLDGGDVSWFSVATNPGKGLRSEWKQAKVVADHHPVGPTSTTGIVAKLLEITRIIPPSEKKAVEKFVQTIDIVDSFLSRAGRTVDVKKEYAKTLCSFSYMLDSDQLYEICTKLPANIWPLTPIPENLLQSIEVFPKKKDPKAKPQDKIKLQELVTKKQVNLEEGTIAIKEKIKAKEFVTIWWKTFLVFGPKDKSIAKDIKATVTAELGYGTITIFDNKDLFIVHDEGIPESLKEIWLVVRDVIFLFNPKLPLFKGKSNVFEENKKKLYAFFASLPDDEWKKFLLEVRQWEQPKENAKEVSPTEKKPTSEKESQTTTPTNTPSTTTISETTSNAPKYTFTKEKVAPFTPILKEIQADFRYFGKQLGSMRSSFRASFRKKPKK